MAQPFICAKPLRIRNGSPHTNPPLHLQTHAQAAAARALGLDVRDVGRLSTQDLHFCGSQLRTCSTGASLQIALDEIKKRQPVIEECLPYAPPSFISVTTQEQMCAKECTDTSPLLAQGKFNYVPLNDLVAAQEHIRRWGAVVSL